MKTSKYALALAVAAALAGAAVQAETKVNRNCAASEAYWSWLQSMNFAGDREMPKTADVGRASPLHPAYYAAQGEREWVGTSATTVTAEVRNPLHPLYYAR